MKVCEFLLQKEGDRVWLPLEPPTVEILEGRYRIVARTQQPQTEVLVEVSYWSPEEMPPKRRTQHWNRNTNAKGIMPVLPFTTLRSGNWRIQCSSNLLMDMGENGWQHIVELRVLAQEEDLENWPPRKIQPDKIQPDKIQPNPAPIPTTAATATTATTAAKLPTPSVSFEIVQPEVQEDDLAVEPRGIDPAIVTSAIVNPTALDLKELDLTELDLRELDPTVEPRAIDQKIDQTIAQTIDQAINQAIDQVIDQAVAQVIDQGIDQTIVDLNTPPNATPDPVSPRPRQATVEELRSLAEQMSRLVLDTVLEAGEMEPIATVAADEDEETRNFFDVPTPIVPPEPAQRPESIQAFESLQLPEPEAFTPLPEPTQPPTAIPNQPSLQPPSQPLDLTVPSGEPTPALEMVPSGLQLRLHTNTIVPSAYNLFELHCYILAANGTPLQEFPLPLQARVTLQNPSNMEVRLAMTQLLATQPLTQPFYVSGHIALDWRNQLLLGEVQLQSLSLSVEDLTEAVVTIATAPFTIMPPVDALLTHISPPEPAPPDVQPTPEPPQTPPAKPRIRADFLEVTRRSLSSLIHPKGTDEPQPSPKVTMPPSLKRPSSDSDSPRPSLHLPTFVQPPSPVPPSEPEGDFSASEPEALVEGDGLEGSLEIDLETLDINDLETDGLETHSLEGESLEGEILKGDRVEIDRSSAEASSPNAPEPTPSEPNILEQLTLLNLAEWTDPSITPSDTEEDSAAPPRKVIELPPVPSRWDDNALSGDEDFLDPLSPNLSVAELAALAGAVQAAWAESPSELTDQGFSAEEVTPETFQAESISEATPEEFTPEESAPEATPEESTSEESPAPAIVDGLNSLDALDLAEHGEYDQFFNDRDRDLEAENEILLGLTLEPESDRFPSILTNVLQGDRSLHLSDAPTSPAVDPEDAVLEPEKEAEDQTFAELDFAALDLSEPDLVALDLATPNLTTPDLTTPNFTTPDLVTPEESDPLLLWDDEPAPEGTPDADAGNFFSQAEFTPTSPQRSDPVLDSFFTEPSRPQNRIPQPDAVPEPLSFDADPESFDPVQVPPHLQLSDTDLGDFPEFEQGATPRQQPRQTEPFVPEHLRQEVVVEDEWLDPDARHWMSLAPPQTIVTWPEEEPLPVPILDIPGGDLVGGENLRVTLRLPETSSRLAVKLWLLDCQTRSLAAGPFWAYQFLSTLPHFREAIVDIPVPLGCLEVQVEALTIESDTQRESHKITVVKTIVPPDTSANEPAENLLEMEDLLEYLPPTLALESLEVDLLDLPEKNP